MKVKSFLGFHSLHKRFAFFGGAASFSFAFCLPPPLIILFVPVHGIGTEATRDKFPLELEKRGYIEKSGNYLKSTLMGRQLISWVKPELKSPELTTEWELKLKKMEKGQYSVSVFRSEIIEFTKIIVCIDDSLKEHFVQSIENSKRKCPKCTKPLT